MSKLLAMPMLLVTLVSTAAYAPGEAPSGSQGAMARGHKPVAHGHDGGFVVADSGNDTWDSDQLAWNQWHFSALDFDSAARDGVAQGHSSAWDEFSRGTLFASASGSMPREAQIALSQEAMRGFDNFMMASAGRVGGGGGSSKHHNGSSGNAGANSGGNSGAPGSSSGVPGTPGAPDESRGPASTSPSDETPLDTAPSNDAPSKETPPNGTPADAPPVNVPEPSSIWLFALGLVGLHLIRRRRAC